MKPISRRRFLQTSGGIGLGLLGSRLKTWAAPNEPVDTLIIGSGYGGAIAALRLAQAGIQTVVLERGLRWPISPPNPSLPDFGQDTFATFEAPDGRASWLSDVTNSLPPNEPIEVYTGVLELINGNGIQVRNGAGVGGGTLAYNAIMLQPRRELFQKVFPTTIDYDQLDQIYYPRVRTMVNGSPKPNYIPQDILESPYYLSTRVNLQQAQNAGFVAGGGNPRGPQSPPKLVEYGVDFNIVRQEINGQARPSAIAGESWYGLNSGAKNSVDHNYLKVAEATGRVQILTLHVVTGISYSSWEKSYVVTANQIDTNGNVLQTVNFVCKRVFMAAGSMGTSALLVRAKATGTLPNLSNQVGQGWGNNGDFVLFSEGLGDNNAGTGGPCGHFVFENLSNPYSPTDMVELVVPQNNAFPGASLYVGLGLAPPIGYFTYDGKTDSVTLNWPTTDPRLANLLKGAASFVSTLYGDNPGTSAAFSSLTTPPALTAHPVGGATYGRVCGQHGQVFGYPGLYVVDGAFVPGGSVGGVNPSFTIAALAERSMDTIVQLIHEGREGDQNA
ncbi:MAG TPA: GMC oxidoreductase [Terriglobia bacterium]|nr:GMC oxidoreductase [Terriglobia bacterium]